MTATLSSPRSRRRGALLGVASLLAAASLAHAAPADAAWSDQFYLSLGDTHWAGGDGEQQQLAMDANGNSLAVWTMSDFTGDGGEIGIQARTISPNGVVGAPKLISPGAFEGTEPAVDVTPSGDALIAWAGTRNDAADAQIGIRRVSATGQLGDVEAISFVGQSAQSPRVAVDAAGNAIVAWRRSDGTSMRVQSRVVAADGTLGPLMTLSAAGQDANGLELAADDAGNGVVVWRRSDGTNSRIEARTMTTAGALGPVSLLSERGRSAVTPVAAPLGGGLSRVAWLRQDTAGDYRTQTRTVSAAGVLGPVRTLSPAGTNPQDLDIDADDTGDAVVVWGFVSPIQARTVSATDAVGPLETLSAAGATGFSPDVAVDAAGDAVAAWESGQSGRVETRTMTAGAWGPSTLISRRAHSATGVQVELDDAGDDATAVWGRTDFDAHGDRRIVAAVGP